MATKPGPLSEWPWGGLGNFKYVVLAPIAVAAIRGDNTSLVLLLLAAVRYLHNQLWISISRYQNARSSHRIQSKSIKFEQIDRESSWDNYILLYTLLFWIVKPLIFGFEDLPVWNAKGLLIITLVHAGPVEFVYYWAHRALHHHSLYNMYHSHHHSSFITEPISAVVHPFAEHMMYVAIFSIAPLASILSGTFSQGAILLYLVWFDFVNNMGHCNFEFIPSNAFKLFPPLKYLIYTASYHSLHHSQVNTNFSLFMPLYDYLYGTVDKSTDTLYEASAKGREEKLDYVYLTHPTDALSIFHMRLGFLSFCARPYSPKWYLWLLWPLAFAVKMFLTLYGKTFVSEKNRFNGLDMQTWVIPRYRSQYKKYSEKTRINKLREESIIDAEKKGAKVLSLGLLNKNFNEGGKLLLKKHENMKIRVADGTTLATAWVINSIPRDEKQVLLICGQPTTMDVGIVQALCEGGLKVQVVSDSFEKFKADVPEEFQENLSQPTSLKEAASICKIWMVGKELNTMDQKKAQKGTRFIPIMPFPIDMLRKDCFYDNTPAMRVPKDMENLHFCENWLPRRVMSVWRVAGILHGLEGWDHHEWEKPITTDSIMKVWNAALKHGFSPYYHSMTYAGPSK